MLLALEGGEPRPAPRAPAPAADVATIAARVEALRGLRFRSRPVPQRVTPAQARREGLEDLDRSYPAARRRADEEVLKLLGLIEPDVDLRSISASVFGEGVAGYYDPRSKRLRIVDGATPGRARRDRARARADARAGGPALRAGGAEGESDDAALARLALVEGTATLVMQDYLLRHVGAEQALSGLLGSALQTGPDLPPFLQAQLIFPYIGGMQFAQALRAARRRLVEAGRPRRPASACPTAPSRSCIRRSGWRSRRRCACALQVALGAGWRRVDARDLGRVADARSCSAGDDAAAAGWGGDRYELWQRGTCTAPPCRTPTCS